MSVFTQQEIDALYAPFPLEAHTTREGHKNKAGTKIQWFTYLDRAAVQRRLEQLFPGEWSVDIIETHREADYVTVSLKMTIRGISRSCNGGQSLKFDKDTIDEDKEKGAWTEAFRRVASVWGIGLYLYEMDFAIWTDSYENGNWDQMRQRESDARGKFADWYKRQYPQQNGGTSRPTPPPPPATGVPTPQNPTPSANGNGSHESSAIVWPSPEALRAVLHRLQGDTGIIEMEMSAFASLAGIESAADLDAWKTKYATGKAAYEAAMAAFVAGEKPATPQNEYHMIVTNVKYFKPDGAGQAYLEFQAPGMPRAYGRTTTFRKMVGDAYYNANGFDAMENADKRNKVHTIAPLEIWWERKQAFNPDGSVKSDYMLITNARPVTKEAATA